MRIYKLRTNHIENPLGFELNRLSLSWVTEAAGSTSTFQTEAQVQVALDEDFHHIIFDSGKKQEIDSLGYTPEVELQPRTRYYWRVTVWGNEGDKVTSDSAWFETAKMNEPWRGQWITPDLDKDIHPLIRKTFSLPDNVVSARLYMCGLGLYEVEINGEKAGNEYLTPGFNAYEFWMQYQSYDITDLLMAGTNSIGITLGNGWYKGRFGFDGGHYELYGDRFAVIGEIIATLKDGTTVVIGTNQEWKCAPSPIIFSGIYDGEIYDANKGLKDWSSPGFDDRNWEQVRPMKVETERLQARISLPMQIKEERKPLKVIHTPAGETVLDMGQNMTGWMRFINRATKGQKLILQYGEILQDGNFYRDNLRTAKAEYIFISDGKEKIIQPRFTFYGFRYVKITGFDKDLNINDFTGCVLYSDIEEIGTIETSNPSVNQLFKNALWGQKGNFLDVPTDCPQRDERMGWTGDAQIFASTACYNMYSPAFYNKFMVDLHEEQKRIGGSVPFMVPTIKPEGDNGFITGNGSSAWGDAATIIPWILYLHYGDKELLRKQFDTMKDWVDYIKKMDDESGAVRLWRTGFHFGDWLALDGDDPSGLTGATDPYYIASAYYCYSAQLTAKAAKILGKMDLAEEYSLLANEVRKAIVREYFTPDGRCAIDTQTALIVALYFDLVPEHYRARLVEDLKVKLRNNKMHLQTGFVGTPYFCNTLSANGASDYAYTLLLNDDYPSWLYGVKLGATTVWERWNSVLPDGSISDTGMNSLNHYAYGSIAEWMYRYMCGINPIEDSPGFRKIILRPQPYGKLKYAKASLNSASGYIESSWEIKEDGTLSFKFIIPFNTSADLLLPNTLINEVTVNGISLAKSMVDATQVGEDVKCELISGTYIFEYVPNKEYLLTYSSYDSIGELLNNKESREIFSEIFPEIANSKFRVYRHSKNTVRELSTLPIVSHFVTPEKLEQLDRKLSNISWSNTTSTVSIKQKTIFHDL
ncbi:alpha-L-rhamnosidase [Priestia filamentosa]|uniref:alpha-L-rhamnosidase n=1 Tax=Priestia filamentosa TaxID=1402861 RepID=UPI000E718B5D|nr:alpha-L-rhamnosidase [Priestia filamentosa]RJS63144.1 alfa-L-rhamnosidase RamA [Priestia filamentosa]